MPINLVFSDEVDWINSSHLLSKSPCEIVSVGPEKCAGKRQNLNASNHSLCQSNRI